MISTDIQAIAQITNPLACYNYARNHEFNINGDYKDSPVILYIEPDQGFLNLSNLTGMIGDGYNLFIRFMELLPDVSIADQADSRDCAIDRQKQWASRFIYTLSMQDKFKDLRSPIPYIRVINAYDANWFGVEINLQNLEYIDPLDNC